jgi:hypothetical protein
MSRLVAVVMAVSMLLGCASSGGKTAVSPVLPSRTAGGDAGTPARAAASAGYTELYVPVSVGVAYIMPTSEKLKDTVGFDIGYTWRKDANWDIEFTAMYSRYTWDNGETKSQAFPVMATARYTTPMYSGAAWYTGLGVGYSFNDPVDMEGSLAGKVVVGITQPLKNEILVGAEVSYYYSKASLKWLPGDMDLSSLQVKLDFIYNF